MPKEEPTLEKTYSQKELDKFVGKGVSAVQSKLTTSRAEIEELTGRLASQDQATLERDQRIQALEESRFEDDPEALAGYRKTRDLEAREARQNKRDAEFEAKQTAHDLEVWAGVMQSEYNKAALEYEVPIEAVEECRSKESLWKVAKVFAKVTKEPEKTVKLDPAIPGGGSPTSDSPEDKVTRGLLKKQQQ